MINGTSGLTNDQFAMKAVESLLDQCVETVDLVNEIQIPVDYSNVSNVLVCGMGGSNLPTYITKGVFSTKVPVKSVNDYSIPSWANNNTLVILSSYSGNTEETLSCAEQALQQGCKIIGITTGGILKEFLEDQNLPRFIYDPIHNPGNMPRYALGYGIYFQIKLFKMLGLLTNADIDDAYLKETCQKVMIKTSSLKTEAKLIAEDIKSDIICVISSEHLWGNGKVFVSMLNESAKTPAYNVYLPEAHHNTVESISKKTTFIEYFMLNSTSYNKNIAKRFQITSQLLESSAQNVQNYFPKGQSRLEQALETLIFTAFVSIYIANKNNLDPLSIPAIDFIKERL